MVGGQQGRARSAEHKCNNWEAIPLPDSICIRIRMGRLLRVWWVLDRTEGPFHTCGQLEHRHLLSKYSGASSHIERINYERQIQRRGKDDNTKYLTCLYCLAPNCTLIWKDVSTVVGYLFFYTSNGGSIISLNTYIFFVLFFVPSFHGEGTCPMLWTD